MVDWSKALRNADDDDQRETPRRDDLARLWWQLIVNLAMSNNIHEASTMKIFFVLIDLGLFPSQFSHAEVEE